MRTTLPSDAILDRLEKNAESLRIIAHDMAEMLEAHRLPRHSLRPAYESTRLLAAAADHLEIAARIVARG
jgi:hypothetical protein